MLRSTTQRWRPSFWLVSMPMRARRGTIPRRCNQTRRSALLYALSPCSLPGLRRRGPRRDRIAGMAPTKGLTANPSGVVAAERPVARGSPPRSVSTCSFEPGLPRSTGFGPVIAPSFSPAPRRHPPRPGTSRSALDCPARRAPPPVDPGPQSGLGPSQKPSMRGGHFHPERRRYPPPGTPAGEHIHDRGEHLAGIRRCPPTTLRALSSLWNQRLDQLPELVGNQPL